jgi:hypothetical protein
MTYLPGESKIIYESRGVAIDLLNEGYLISSGHLQSILINRSEDS